MAHEKITNPKRTRKSLCREWRDERLFSGRENRTDERERMGRISVVTPGTSAILWVQTNSIRMFSLLLHYLAPSVCVTSLCLCHVTSVCKCLPFENSCEISKLIWIFRPLNSWWWRSANSQMEYRQYNNYCEKKTKERIHFSKQKSCKNTRKKSVTWEGRRTGPAPLRIFKLFLFIIIIIFFNLKFSVHHPSTALYNLVFCVCDILRFTHRDDIEPARTLPTAHNNHKFLSCRLSRCCCCFVFLCFVSLKVHFCLWVFVLGPARPKAVESEFQQRGTTIDWEIWIRKE
jgi:hypothetical protein